MRQASAGHILTDYYLRSMAVRDGVQGLQRGIGYALSITLALYALSLALYRYAPSPSLAARLLAVLTALALSYTIARVFHVDPFRRERGAPLSESLVHSLALLALLYAFSVVGVLVLGPRRFYEIARPGYVEEWEPALLAYAPVFWTVSGIITVYFYDAAAYDLFNEVSRARGILAATLTFALNYNQPLLTGFWSLEDILFYGLAFTYSYSVKRNPVALVVTYLVSEGPLWWCILAPLGVEAFTLYIYMRLALSLAAGALVLSKPKKVKSTVEEFERRGTEA